MIRKFFALGWMLVLLAAPLISGGPVPVLCYHGFTDDSASAKGKLTETYRQFETMLQFLSQHGYASCFPEDVQSGKCNSEKSVIITFDDGTKEQLRAGDLLERYGFKGIFFVVPVRVTDQSDRYLTSAEVNLLAARGHHIGVHGYAHKPLTSSPIELQESVGHSLEILRQTVHSGQAFNDFAFPFGHYDNNTVAVLARTYRYLYTVNPGYWDGNSTLLPRLVLTADESPAFYQRYVLSAASFRQSLSLVSEEGAMCNVVEFQNEGGGKLDSLGLMSVSPDAEGRLYAFHTLTKHMVVDGMRVLIDLKSFMRQYYSSPRRVIAYALVTRSGDELRYLSGGHTHWIGD